MKQGRGIGLKIGAILFAAVVFGFFSSTASAATLLTGTHWASTSDYQNLKNDGLNFVVTTVSPTDQSSWASTFQAAKAAGLKLIIGAYPAPYTLNSDGTWTISPAGVQFLQYLAANSSSVMAVFVFNEPYWVNPATGVTNACGSMTAANLQTLRTTIQGVWSGAKIYDDLGSPQWWSPSGAGWTSCIGNKYANQEGVADYVGIWDYPFTTSGFTESSSLADLQSEANYVTNSMGAVPILLGQTFASASNNLVYPTTAQLSKWNCDMRTISSAGGISWYVWNQALYSDYLANHSEDIPFLTASSCTPPAPVTPVVTTPAVVVSTAAPATTAYVSVSPNSSTGVSQTFTFTLADSESTNNIQGANILINSAVDGRNACWMYYSKSGNTLSLSDDATDAWSAPSTIGSNTTLSNSQCSITLSNVSVANLANTVMTLSLPITFTSSSFAGTKNIYSLLSDSQVSSSAYVSDGVFQVLAPTVVTTPTTPVVTAPASTPAPVTVTPSPTSTIITTPVVSTPVTVVTPPVVVTTPIKDTIPPSIPASLTAAAVSTSQVNLSWKASTDNVGVVGYKVFRNGLQIATTTQILWGDASLSPGTTYKYTVAAYDAAGNISAQSTGVSVTTKALTFAIGTPVETTARLRVRSNPSLFGSILGVQPNKAIGTIIKGPVTANGNIWWDINYNTGVDGWSSQSWLTIIPGVAINPPPPTEPQVAIQTVSSTPSSSVTTAVASSLASIVEQFQQLLQSLVSSGK